MPDNNAQLMANNAEHAERWTTSKNLAGPLGENKIPVQCKKNLFIKLNIVIIYSTHNPESVSIIKVNRRLLSSQSSVAMWKNWKTNGKDDRIKADAGVRCNFMLFNISK